MASTTKLTSKERVLTAFQHQEPDRVPFDYLYNEGIDSRLKQHFHLKPDDHEGLLQALSIDFRNVGPAYKGPRLHLESPNKDIRVCPEWGFHTQYVDFGYGGFWDFCEFPLKDATDKQLEEWPFPNPDHYNYDEIEQKSREWSKQNLAVSYGNPGICDVLNQTGIILSVEDTLMRLASYDDALLDWVDRRLAVQLAVAERALDRAKGSIDFFWMGEDLGTQKGPMISQSFFDGILRERHQKFIDLAKSHNLPVMFHSCGSSSWSFDSLSEMGVDIMDTLQPEAAKMDPQFLKATYGDRLSFHGCISTAGPLSKGTPEEVEQDVKEKLEILMPKGGYALSPTHQIQDNSPIENVLAMYAAGEKYSRY